MPITPYYETPDGRIKLYNADPRNAALWGTDVAASIDVVILSLPFGSDRGTRRGRSYAQWAADFTTLAGLIPRATCKAWLVHLGVERAAALGTNPWEYAVTAATAAGWQYWGTYRFQRDDQPFTRDAWREASNGEYLVALHNGALDALGSDPVTQFLGAIPRNIANPNLYLGRLAYEIAQAFPNQVICDPLADNGYVLAGVKQAGGQARGIETDAGRCAEIKSLLEGL